MLASKEEKLNGLQFSSSIPQTSSPPPLLNISVEVNPFIPSVFSISISYRVSLSMFLHEHKKTNMIINTLYILLFQYWASLAPNQIINISLGKTRSWISQEQGSYFNYFIRLSYCIPSCSASAWVCC